MYYNPKELDSIVDELLKKRGLLSGNGDSDDHVAKKAFGQQVKANLCYYASALEVDASHTIELLLDDNNLVDNQVLYKNFQTELKDIINPKLYNDPLFFELFQLLLHIGGKGVGGGELVLPLIISGYKFSNTSDGVLNNGAKVEVKKNGSSLKPIKTGLTEKGHIDKLNKKHFDGTVVGCSGKGAGRRGFEAHCKAVSNDPYGKYSAFFQELYPGRNTTKLAEEVANSYLDPTLVRHAIGKFALESYKEVDGWNNIIFIDQEKLTITNICNVYDIDKMSLSFSPKMKRGRDTQAIADGYVNLTCGTTSKLLEVC